VTRKSVGILAGIVVVLLGALLAIPALIDWTHFKDDLAIRMEGVLGRKFSIDGKVSFSFLPSPTFLAETVHLAEQDGAAQGISIVLPRLEVRPRLLPLLAGRLEIASLVLISPEIHLTRLVTADTEGRWDTTGTQQSSIEPAPPAGSASAPQPSSIAPSFPNAQPSPITKSSPIDSVTLKNGTLVYEPAGRPTWRFDKVEASFAAQSGGGGRLVGAARFAGLNVSFEAVHGSAMPGQATPMNFSLSTTEGAGVLRLGGQVTGAGDDRRLKGKLSFKAGDLSRLLAALGDRAPPLALPLGNVGLEATVNGSKHEIDLDALTMTLGGVEGTGNASLTFGGTPQFDLKLGFGRLDLDSLLAGLRAVTPPGPSEPVSSAAYKDTGKDAGTSLTDAPVSNASVQSGGFSLPTGFSASVDLNAGLTVFHGGLLQGAHVNAVLANGEVTLNQASLSLPGNSEANLFGFLVAPQGVPSFEGSFEAASDDLRGLLDWLKVDTSSVPADRLHAARLAGNVKISSGVIDFSGTQIRLDGTKIDTAATLRLGERPALGASFAVDTLNADAYWPRPKDEIPTERPAPSANSPSANAPAANGPVAVGLSNPSPASPFFASWLSHLDANVKGRIGQLVARGLTAQEVTVDGSWLQGQLGLRDLSVGDLVGAQLHLDGGIDGLSEGPVGFRALHYLLRSKQPDRLIRQIGLTLPIDAEKLGAVSMSGTLDGGLDAVTIDSRTDIAGGVLALAGKLATPLASPHFEGTLDASHANFSQLLRIWAPDYRPASSLGAFAATAHVAGDASVLSLTDLKIKAGPVAATGDVRVLLVGKPRIDAALSTGELPIDSFLQVNRPSATNAVPPPTREEPRHGLPVTPPDRVLAAPRAAVMAGAIPEYWSREPLALSWLSRCDGALKLDAKAMSFGHSHIDGVSLGIDLVNGTASLQRLAALLYGGKLTGSGHFSADGNWGLQLGLAHAQMRNALPSAGDVDVADGAMDGDLTLATSGLSIAEWIGRLAGTGKFSVTDGVVSGFDLKAVDDRVQSLDSPTGLLSLFQAGLSGGKTHFSSLSGTLRVNNGLITTDDIHLIADGGGANVSAQINLPAYMMDGRAEFHLASAPAGPPLVMRLSGPLENPRRFVDINEIQQWLMQKGKVKPKDLLKGFLKELAR
jgi:hypothetical protein